MGECRGVVSSFPSSTAKLCYCGFLPKVILFLCVCVGCVGVYL